MEIETMIKTGEIIRIVCTALGLISSYLAMTAYMVQLKNSENPTEIDLQLRKASLVMLFNVVLISIVLVIVK